jgi:serine/threonine-protein kinase
VIKVLDFGLAQLIEDCQASADAAGAPITKGIIVGTPAYLPPEAAQWSPARRDPRSDQWSLGVVLYHMLAGQLPFPQRNPYELYSAICYDEPIPLAELVPNLPAHVYATVQTALAKSVDQRFPSVKDFLRALDALPPLPSSFGARHNSRDTLAETPSLATLEMSRRDTPLRMESLTQDDESGPQRHAPPPPASAKSPPLSTINSAPYSPLSTVQYSFEELQALANASRCEAVPMPVKEEQITARYLNSQHLVEDTPSDPSLEQRLDHGATISLTADEAASLGLPGLTRQPPRPPRLPSFAEPSPSSPDERVAPSPTKSEPSVSRSKPEPSASVPPPDTTATAEPPAPVSSGSVATTSLSGSLAWLQQTPPHSLRQGLLMMGIGVVLSLLTGWALGLFGSQRAGRTVAQVTLPNPSSSLDLPLTTSRHMQEPAPTAAPTIPPSATQPTPTSAQTAPMPNPQVGRPVPARSAPGLRRAPIPPLRTAKGQ